MARSTRSSSRRNRRASPTVPDSDEEDVVRPYVRPARLESPFATDRMAAAISLTIPHQPSSRIPQPRRVYHQRQRPPPVTATATATAAFPADVQAALRRSQEAEANLRRSAFNDNDDRTIIDSLEIESVMNQDAAIMEAVDENTADLDALLPHLPRTANELPRRNHGHRHGIAIPRGGRGGRSGRGGRGRRTGRGHRTGRRSQEVHIKSPEENALPYWLAFMRWRDNAEYEADHVFTVEQRNAVLPIEIARYLKFKAYGNADARSSDLPTVGRASSLEHYKKCISKFMTTTYPYNDQAKVGNPTQSTVVNQVIKDVKLMQCRKLGKPSQARSAFTEAEFERIVSMLESTPDDGKRLFLSAIYRFQLHLGGRIDDTSKVLKKSMKHNTDPAIDLLSLLTQICWSKNVRTEQNIHDQIMLGAGHVDYCVLLGMASWLEFSLASGWQDSSNYLFCYDGLNNHDAIKRAASSSMAAILKDDSFLAMLVDGSDDDDQDAVLRGTHSFRKFAAQYARNKGCSRDAVDVRFRWKNQRMQDRYVQGIVPYEDAHVAECLCKGGPISYQVKKEANISDEWILEFVVPNIARKYSKKVALVLGHALLWRCMDPVQSKVLPTMMVSTVRRQYYLIDNILDNDENPIVRVPLSISGEGGGLVIVEHLDDNAGPDYDEDGNELTPEQKRNQRRARYDDDAIVRRINAKRSDNVQVTQLTSHIILLRRENENLKVQLGLMQDRLEKCMNKVNKNIINILQRPYLSARKRGGTAGVQAIDQNVHVAGNAMLMRGPKTLNVLWQEWTHGIGSNKPAVAFTATERGLLRNKSTFCLRMNFWRVIRNLVLAGISATNAIDRVYAAYPQSGRVSRILLAMRKDSVDKVRRLELYP